MADPKLQAHVKHITNKWLDVDAIGTRAGENTYQFDQKGILHLTFDAVDAATRFVDALSGGSSRGFRVIQLADSNKENTAEVIIAGGKGMTPDRAQDLLGISLEKKEHGSLLI